MAAPCKNDTPPQACPPSPRSQHGTRPDPAPLAPPKPPAAKACPLAGHWPPKPPAAREPKGRTNGQRGGGAKKGRGGGAGLASGAGRAGLNQNQHGVVCKRWPCAARWGNAPTPAASGLRVGHSEGRGGRAQRITNNTSNDHLLNIGQLAQGFTNRN